MEQILAMEQKKLKKRKKKRQLLALCPTQTGAGTQMAGLLAAHNADFYI